MPQADLPSAALPARAGLKRRLELARLALLWERLVPALGPAAAVAGLFLALALFDLPARLPSYLHAALLAVLAALFAAALVVGLRRLRLPDRDAARRRIETQSGLAHRPLAALDDKLAGGSADPSTEALWQLHRARMAEAIRRLKVGVPEPGLTRRDPYALRAALALALVLGFIDAGGDWADRIGRSLSPTELQRGRRRGAGGARYLADPARLHGIAAAIPEGRAETGERRSRFRSAARCWPRSMAAK